MRLIAGVAHCLLYVLVFLLPAIVASQPPPPPPPMPSPFPDLSCTELFGSAPEFVLCEETETTCSFNARMDGGTCDQMCASLGSTCVGAINNGESCEELPNNTDTCETPRNTDICICKRPEDTTTPPPPDTPPPPPPSESQPNLQPTEITFDPSTAIVGGTVFFDSGVRNTGDVDSDVFSINWFVNNQEVEASGNHAGVPAGQTVMDDNSQFSWTFDSPGTYSVTYTVDVDNHVEESNEEDNSTTVEVVVVQPSDVPPPPPPPDTSPPPPPSPITVQQVSAGLFHTCALLSDGTLKCWGYNESGELGDSHNVDSTIPVNVFGINNAIHVSARGEAEATHTCAVLFDGTVKCWGSNKYGQLGDGTQDNRNTPVPVTGINNATAVSAGEYHTCALLEDSTVQCWGANSYGQLGNNTDTDNSTVPVTVSGINNAINLAIGGHHTCAVLSDGIVKCWGDNSYGELGNGDSAITGSVSPVPVTGINNATAVSAGHLHTCALLSDGTLKCWGLNYAGQLGNGNTTDSNTPVPVTGINNATAVSAGFWYTCALLSDDTVQCWGFNEGGQLGDGTTTNSTIPVNVFGVNNAIQVSAGGNHTCILTPVLFEDGTVQCWGANDAGWLGDGTQERRLVPTPIEQADIITKPQGRAPNLVVLVHGCCNDASGVKVWRDIRKSIEKSIMQTQPLGEWEIVVWDWHDKTPTDCIYIGVCADKAYDAAYDHDGKQGQSGYLAGAINAYSSYKYIHFIAHSAGAKLINEVAKTLARDKSEGGERPFIHLTFLDAYAPNGEDREGDKSYGYLQDYHNHYYSEHYVDRTYSQIPDWIILTNTVLPHAFNFDITGWGDEKDGSEYGHKWPRVWYTRSIGFPNRTGGGLLGFGLSLEGNNKNFCRLAEQFPPGDSCQLNNIGSAGLCGTFIRNSAPCR